MPRLLPSIIITMPLVISTAVQASVDEKIKQLEARIDQLESGQRPTSEPVGINVYGSFRPALTYKQDNREDNDSLDITDFFSRLGLRGSQPVGETLQAFFQGEWDIDIEADSDFGDARLAYAGIESNYGRLAIGKQWNAHYNLVAAPTDIFNHRSSPFGYDDFSPFRTNNYVHYQIETNGIRYELGVQVDGDPETPNGGVNSASNPDNVDSIDTGVHFNTDIFSVAFSFRQVKYSGDRDDDRILGVAGSIQLNDSVYLASTYQDIDINNNDGHTLDLVGSYKVNEQITFKGGLFSVDDGVDGDASRERIGFNATVEKQLTEQVRIHVEWLHNDFDATDSVDTLSFGIRYDFERTF